MKNKLLILGLILLVVINLATLATFAITRWQFHRRISRVHKPRHFELLKKELDLNQDQVEHFKQRIEHLRSNVDPITDSIEAKRIKIFEYATADEIDRDKIYGLVDEIGILQVQLQKKIIDNFLNEQSVLTPEQKRKFAELLKEVNIGGKPFVVGKRGHRDWKKWHKTPEEYPDSTGMMDFKDSKKIKPNK